MTPSSAPGIVARSRPPAAARLRHILALDATGMIVSGPVCILPPGVSPGSWGSAAHW